MSKPPERPPRTIPPITEVRAPAPAGPPSRFRTVIVGVLILAAIVVLLVWIL
jgi:hypothetical protein